MENGKLQIIDRRKNIFKLAQGLFVSPELLENKFLEVCNRMNAHAHEITGVCASLRYSRARSLTRSSFTVRAYAKHS